MQENTLLTRENMKALEYLVDFVSDSNSNNKDFENNNRELLDMYVELVKNSAFYTLDEKKQLIKKYGSRTLNQINVEDLAKSANNMNIALDYLLNEKEDKQDFDKFLIYSEVFEILKNLEEEKINLISNAIISTIKMMANPNYKEKINWSKKLSSQNLQQDTINIIGYLYYNYWCDTDENKKIYREIVYNNKYNNKIPNASNIVIKKNK